MTGAKVMTVVQGTGAGKENSAVVDNTFVNWECQV